jgi:Flp pilus assembly protein TadG
MKLGKSRKGQIGVIMALVIATLLGVMTLCADVGVMYYNYLRLQKGTDAAAVAGANYLNGGVTFASASVNANCTGEPDDAQKAACTYAISNGLATDANSLKMNENVAVGPTPNLQVIANASLPYMFGRVIGLSTYKVAAVATANQLCRPIRLTVFFQWACSARAHAL